MFVKILFRELSFLLLDVGVREGEILGVNAKTGCIGHGVKRKIL